MKLRENGGDQLDDPRLWRPMSCAVCASCFQDMRALRLGRLRCFFGGPFSGYVRLP
jgi:hypothetical protein